MKPHPFMGIRSYGEFDLLRVIDSVLWNKVAPGRRRDFARAIGSAPRPHLFHAAAKLALERTKR